MNTLKKVQKLVVDKLHISKHRDQLKTFYVKFGHYTLVNYVLPNLNIFIRHLIKKKGLDPDFAPCKLQTTLIPEQFKEKLNNIFSGSNYYVHNTASEKWVRESFKDLDKHPVLKSRIQFENKQKAPEPLSIIIEEPLQVSINEDITQKIHTACKNIQEVVLPETEKAVKRSTKRTHDKKPNEKKSTVTKSFNGDFRRVSDK